MYNHDIPINVTCYRIIQDAGVKLNLKEIRMPELHPVTVDLVVVIDFVCRTLNCNNLLCQIQIQLKSVSP